MERVVELVEDSQSKTITIRNFADEFENSVTEHTLINANSLSSTSKGKYYKQTYRTAWELEPDFKGWLTGVAGEATRAYCIFCEKSLHAHRLSLLKHTCTIRHQKAAQLHHNRKQQTTIEISSLTGENSSDQHNLHTEVELVESMDPFTTNSMENETHESEEDEEEETMHYENLPVNFQKHHNLRQVMSSSSNKPPISCHVLDTSRGSPISGLQVSLYKLIDGRWTYINEGLTSTDGRFANFLDAEDFHAGRYKLHFDVDKYFKSKSEVCLYPFVEIIFDSRPEEDHYHIPLLISPFGYTTYKGS